MTNYQEFVAKTLVDIYLDEFIQKARMNGELCAYDLLDNKWTFYAMTATGKRICQFHSMDLNNRQLEDTVEAVIAVIYDEVEEYMTEFHREADYGINW